MSSLQKVFNGAVKPLALAAALATAGCGGNPHLRGEQSGAFAGGVAALAANVFGQDAAVSALTGLLIGGITYFILETTEDDCYRVQGAVNNTRDNNGSFVYDQRTNTTLVCKPEGTSREQANATLEKAGAGIRHGPTSIRQSVQAPSGEVTRRRNHRGFIY